MSQSMDFNHYKQTPTEYPTLKEVATEYLVKPNGKPTLLTYLLKDLGCTIHKDASARGFTPVVNTETMLDPVIKAAIDDYMRYHDNHPDQYDESAIGDAMREQVSRYLDPSDFIPESLELKPISINDIEKFMADISMMRVGKSENFKNNGNPNIQKLQKRINQTCEKLADAISEYELRKVSKNCDDISNIIRQEIGKTTGFNRFVRQIGLLKSGMYQKNWIKINTQEAIKDEHIIQLFTILRALTRACNDEAGILAKKEEENGPQEIIWKNAA